MMNSLSLKAPTSPNVLHPHLKEVIDECELMSGAETNANLMLVCGPTGVGKSTLGRYLVDRQFERSSEQMLANPGFIPAIRVEAPSSGEKTFSWRDFFIRMLRELEGDLDLPRSASGIDPNSGRAFRASCPLPNRLSDLRCAFERALRARGVRFIVVDEAAHIMKQTDPRHLENQINTLKSLSNECDVQWILLGSYDLFELMSLSGQLARRTHVVHFKRYLSSDPAQAKYFFACIKALVKDIPALESVDVLSYAPLLMDHTLGCVGTLRTALVRLGLLVHENKGWSPKLLDRALLTPKQLSQITTEVLEGEVMIQPGIASSIEPIRITSKSKRVA